MPVINGSGFPVSSGAPAEPTFEYGSYGLPTGGLDFTSGSTNAKGAYVNFGAPLTDSIDEIVLRFLSGNAQRQHVIDIGVGGAAIIGDLHVHLSQNQNTEIAIPVHIPVGSQLQLRFASTSGGVVLTAAARGVKRNPAQSITSARALVATGATIATSGFFGAIGSAPAWTQAGSALASAAKGFIATFGTGADTGRTLGNVRYQIGTGPDVANVTPILEELITQSTTNVVSALGRPIIKDFPIGTKFWHRAIHPSAVDDYNGNIEILT